MHDTHLEDLSRHDDDGFQNHAQLKRVTRKRFLRAADRFAEAMLASLDVTAAQVLAATPTNSSEQSAYNFIHAWNEYRLHE